MRRRRVQEGDQRPLRAGPWRLVDKPHARGLEHRQRAVNVIDGERHVVQPGAALLEEPGDWRTRGRGLEQFQLAFAGRQEMRAHLLARHLLDVRHLQAKAFPVERRSRLRVRYGDADMIEPDLHGVPLAGPSARARIPAAAV